MQTSHFGGLFGFSGVPVQLDCCAIFVRHVNGSTDYCQHLEHVEHCCVDQKIEKNYFSHFTPVRIWFQNLSSIATNMLHHVQSCQVTDFYIKSYEMHKIWSNFDKFRTTCLRPLSPWEYSLASVF